MKQCVQSIHTQGEDTDILKIFPYIVSVVKNNVTSRNQQWIALAQDVMDLFKYMASLIPVHEDKILFSNGFFFQLGNNEKDKSRKD